MKYTIKTLALAAAITASAYSQADWSTYSLTSTSAGMAPMAMTEDDSGYVYVVGNTPGGNGNICVQKFDTSGSLVTSAEFGNGNDLEEGFDIQFGPDGNLYFLGRTGSALWVECINTSLSSIWQKTITTTTPTGSTSPNLPYRIAMGGSAGTPICYATTHVRETLGGTVDLTSLGSPKAVFVAKIVSGGTPTTATWNGSISGTPDNLYGAHAISNGLALVTDSKYAYSSGFGSSTVSRVQYTKFDSSLSLAWSTPTGTVDPNANNHLDIPSQTMMIDDKVYTSFSTVTIDPVSSDYGLDCNIGMDCSGGSAGSWLPSPNTSYHRTGYVTGPNVASWGGGTGYWQSQVVSVGWGHYLSSVFDGDTYPTYYGSWIRQVASADGGSILDGILNTTGSSFDKFRPDQNQRCFSAANGHLAGLARLTDSTHFYYLTDKVSAGSATGTATLTSGYATDQIRQVMASRNSNRVYILLDVYNSSSIHRTALYAFDR